MTVSYCIPLYNKERHIAAVLEAALAERAATGGEVLVYDDASTDRSLAIVEAMAAQAPIRLITGGSNRGVFHATAILIGTATQPFLRLIDADDRVVPGSTAHLLDLLDRHGAILASGILGTQAVTPASDYAGAETRIDERPFRLLLRNIDFNLSASVMPTGAAQAALPLPTDLRIAQDLCMALRLAKRGRLVRSDAVVALQPPESTNRLSRRLAAMYRDICLIIAGELTAEATQGDAAYAVRRQAGRCAHYFRREAPGLVGWHDRVFLTQCRIAMSFEPVTQQADRLRRIATLFGRDEARVLS